MNCERGNVFVLNVEVFKSLRIPYRNFHNINVTYKFKDSTGKSVSDLSLHFSYWKPKGMLCGCQVKTR